jgi:SH3-like domain-containing protein
MNIKRINLSLIFCLLFTQLLSAEEYFLTLRNKKANLRQGPSFDYPVKIFYKKKHLPVLVQDSSGNFRKIIDHENNAGWLHISQLSKKKAALTSKTSVVMFKNSTIYSPPLAVLEKGRLCIVVKCRKGWCKIKVDKYVGWVEKNELRGRL